MKEGKILKAYGGYFFVHDFESKNVYRCGVRGRLKQNNIEIIAGDIVQFAQLEAETGIVEARKERFNKLFRPPVANVEQILLVFAATEPEIDLKLLDRMLVLAEDLELDVAVCINKIDLVMADKLASLDYYQQAGYDLFYTSAETETGLAHLKELFTDKVSVLAGPSGVGKSSLLNAIEPNLELATGELSKKINRGRHTTRHVELIKVAQGWVADTPGFSSLHFKDISSYNLQYFFPEMVEYINDCKFTPCSHSHEPKCAVKAAKEAGEIAEVRYEHYLEFLAEIKKREEHDYKR